MRTLMMAVVLLTAVAAHAQWRVGATIGGDHNFYSMNKQYMTDVEVQGSLGLTAGATGQYDFYDWLGVRVDLNYTQKNYQLHRAMLDQWEYCYRNDYVQLPVMATFSFGGTKLRGFCNLGFYTGIWLNSHLSGTDFNVFSGKWVDVNEDVKFNSDRDNRWDAGLLASAGLDYRMDKNWGIQFETRYYHGLTSTTKSYMRVKDYRYNSTLAFQVGVYYVFNKREKDDD